MKYRTFCGFLVLTTLFASLFSCDVSGDNTDVATEINIAETVVYDFRQVRVEKGRPLYEVQAARGETYTTDQLMKVYDANFEQYDKERQVVTEGIAAQVDFNIETEDATVTGAMDFKSNTENVRLKSEWLNWESEKKILSGNETVPVRLEKENGTMLEGKGFKAFADSKTVYFENGMNGIFIPEKKEKEAETESPKKGPKE